MSFRMESSSLRFRCFEVWFLPSSWMSAMLTSLDCTGVAVSMNNVDSRNSSQNPKRAQ